MKKTFLLLLCLSMLACPFNAVAESNSTINESAEILIPNEIIVYSNVFYDPADYSNFELFDFNGISATSIDSLFPATSDEDVTNWIDKVGYRFSYLITLSPACTIETALEILDESPNILSAKPNFRFTTETEPTDAITPDDATQWAHEYIGLLDAWEYGFVGSDLIRVAVLDTGFVAHSDLQTNVNWSEAYDVIDNDTDVTTTDRHGNFVTGIIGADYGEDNGINGVCKSVDIIPIKMYDSGCEDNDILEAINLAISKNVKIINLSFSLPDRIVDDEFISTIEEANVLFVTSAGNNFKNIANDSKNLGKVNDSPNWIVVGALTPGETKAYFSNYSPLYVDLFAPGTNIYSTDISGYASSEGTSYAAPYVTAACALIMSHATHLTPLQVKQLLMDNVKEIDGFDLYCVSGGALSIVNAANALFAENRGAYSKGDINGDSYITDNDRTLARGIVMNTIIPNETQRSAADVNQDGIINHYDYTLISRFCQKTIYFAP